MGWLSHRFYGVGQKIPSQLCLLLLRLLPGGLHPHVLCPDDLLSSGSSAPGEPTLAPRIQSLLDHTVALDKSPGRSKSGKDREHPEGRSLEWRRDEVVAQKLKAQHPMSDKLYLIRFKGSELSFHAVIAARAEIHGEHLVFLRSDGKLAALFLLEIIEKWSEFELYNA